MRSKQDRVPWILSACLVMKCSMRAWNSIRDPKASLNLVAAAQAALGDQAFSPHRGPPGVAALVVSPFPGFSLRLIRRRGPVAGRRADVLDIRELIRRVQMGEGDRGVARDLGVSRKTV